MSCRSRVLGTSARTSRWRSPRTCRARPRSSSRRDRPTPRSRASAASSSSTSSASSVVATQPPGRGVRHFARRNNRVPRRCVQGRQRSDAQQQATYRARTLRELLKHWIMSVLPTSTPRERTRRRRHPTRDPSRQLSSGTGGVLLRADSPALEGPRPALRSQRAGPAGGHAARRSRSSFTLPGGAPRRRSGDARRRNAASLSDGVRANRAARPSSAFASSGVAPRFASAISDGGSRVLHAYSNPGAPAYT